MLAEHGAQRRLRQHVGGGQIVLHMDDGAFRVDHVEIEDRVDLHRDIVAGDHVLGRDLDDPDAQVDPHHFLEEGRQQDQAGAPYPLEASQGEDHAPLIFAQDPDRRSGDDDGDEHDDRHEIGEHRRIPRLVRTRATGAARDPYDRSGAAPAGRIGMYRAALTRF